MKRLWIAVVLMSLAFSLCSTSLRYQHHQIDVLLTQLDDLETAASEKSLSQAIKQAEQFTEEYRERTRLFPCFMSHNDLSGCQETVATLPTALRTKHIEEFYLEVSRCREQLNRLRDVEAPILQNIL